MHIESRAWRTLRLWLCATALGGLAAAPAAHARPTPTPTPGDPCTFNSDCHFGQECGPGNTCVPARTPTPTIPSCASQQLDVNPVTSPSNSPSQTITACRSSFHDSIYDCADVTASSEAGIVSGVSGGSCGGSGIAASATVSLLPGQTIHLEVCATQCGCPITLCTQYDRNGDPLTIVSTAAVTETLIGGKKLSFKDKDSDSSKRKLIVQSKDPNISVDGGDPSALGAVLQIIRPDPGGERTSIALPAGGWTGVGNPPGASGYKYQDATLANGPCKKAQLKSGAFKALCSGAGITFTLNESAQNDLAVELDLGDSRQCMEFGGQIIKDVGTSTAKTGTFKAANAPPPAACQP